MDVLIRSISSCYVQEDLQQVKQGTCKCEDDVMICRMTITDKRTDICS